MKRYEKHAGSPTMNVREKYLSSQSNLTSYTLVNNIRLSTPTYTHLST